MRLRRRPRSKSEVVVSKAVPLFYRTQLRLSDETRRRVPRSPAPRLAAYIAARPNCISTAPRHAFVDPAGEALSPWPLVGSPLGVTQFAVRSARHCRAVAFKISLNGAGVLLCGWSGSSAIALKSPSYGSPGLNPIVAYTDLTPAMHGI